MMSSTRHRLSWTALLIVALIGLRVAGAHLHLCFDGAEPPATLHVADAGHHDEYHASEEHADVDVSLMTEAAGKIVKPGLDSLLLAVLVLSLALLLWPSAIRWPRDLLSWVVTRPNTLRPPLRGPPAFISL